MSQALLTVQCPRKRFADAGDAKRDCGRTLKLAGKVKAIQGHPAIAEQAKAEGLKNRRRGKLARRAEAERDPARSRRRDVARRRLRRTATWSEESERA